VPGLPEQPSPLLGRQAVRLACPPTRCSVGPVNFDDFDSLAAQESRQAGAIGAGALHADRGDFAESLEPGKQRFLTCRRRLERFGTEHSYQGVERSGNVNIEVSVNATRYTNSSFYHGHGQLTADMKKSP
jgi:hypothetical protein